MGGWRTVPRIRSWLWWRLECLAARVAPDEAFRHTHLSFTFEDRKGIVVNEDGRGCPLWYKGKADYARAHDEARPLDWWPPGVDGHAEVRRIVEYLQAPDARP